MDSRNKRILNDVLKFIFFPFYIIYYSFRALLGKVRLSIRLSLTYMYFRLFVRIIILASISILIVFSYYKLSFVPSGYFSLTSNASSIIRMEPDIINELSRKSIKFVLFNETGSVIHYSDDILSDQEPEKNIMKKNINDSNYLLFPYTVAEGGKTYYFNLYADITKEINDVIKLAKIAAICTLISIFLAFIMIIYAGSSVFYPITEMTQAAKRISDKNMNVRLNVGSYKNELKDLARTFNEMMDRIEDGYNKQKQFVSDASHELRTPIAVLQGYVDMLNRWGKNDPEVLNESLDALKNESENMKDLVEKLLFLARNDRGTMTLQRVELDISSLVEEAAREIRFIDKSHSVSCKIQSNVVINADRVSIKQALRIFLDNAIKYTPEKGKITIRVFTENSRAVIEIADTGIGMSKEEILHIFDRFYRSDTSRKRDSGGHGLGLSIAKIIILSHSGKINVRSKPGEGTTISIYLPL